MHQNTDFHKDQLWEHFFKMIYNFLHWYVGNCTLRRWHNTMYGRQDNFWRNIFTWNLFKNTIWNKSIDTVKGKNPLLEANFNGGGISNSKLELNKNKSWIFWKHASQAYNKASKKLGDFNHNGSIAQKVNDENIHNFTIWLLPSQHFSTQ